MQRTRDEKGRFIPEHNGTKTRLYKVWCAMKERCYNKHNKKYYCYGAKGISVCDMWINDFAAFRSWSINNGYKDGLTIDRIDGNKGYEPSNCRWVTRSVQNRNYSRNHFITYQGKTKCLSDWADYFGINKATVLFRIKQGKSLDEVFSQIDGRSKRWQK